MSSPTRLSSRKCPMYLLGTGSGQAGDQASRSALGLSSMKFLSSRKFLVFLASLGYVPGSLYCRSSPMYLGTCTRPRRCYSAEYTRPMLARILVRIVERLPLSATTVRHGLSPAGPAACGPTSGQGLLDSDRLGPLSVGLQAY